MSTNKNTRKHPLAAYLLTLLEANQLIIISDDLKDGKVKDLNNKKRALYRATIIHLCAAWETYLEAVVEDAIKCVIKNSNKSNQIPINILQRLSIRLNSEKDIRSIWKISDDGWKNEIVVNFSLLKDKFNTPRPTNVDEFVFQTIGLKHISSHWKWAGHSKENSISKLNMFMDLRGNITHRLVSDKNINSKMITDYINFLYRITTICSNVIRLHTHKLVGTYPWKHVELKTLL